MADTLVTVEFGADDNLHVASIERSSGPIPDEQRRRVLAYTESPDPVTPHPEFAPIALEQGDPQADGDALIYQVASYWAGPIPDRRLTFGCYAQAFDDGGAVVYESQSFAFESPAEDAYRGGGILSSGFPASTGATSVEMVCEEFTGPGWEIASAPQITQPAEAAHVRVRADLVWEQRAILGLRVVCTTTVLGPDGVALGQVTHPRGSPSARAGDEPPFRDELDVIVDVPVDSDATDATFECTFPRPPTRASEEMEEPDEDHEEESQPAPRPAGEPPNGPRELIATGTFDGDEWGELAGEQWWLEAWQVGAYRCWSFTMVERGGTGRACEASEQDPASEEYIGSSGSTPGPQYNAHRTIIYGELRPEVSYIEIELSNGRSYRIDSLVPDPELGIEAHYYVAFVEAAESYSVSAYDADGNLLQGRDFNKNG